MLRLLIGLVLLAGCSVNPESNVIRDTQNNGGFVIDTTAVPPPIDLPPAVEPSPDPRFTPQVVARVFSLTVYSSKEGCEGCDRFKRFFNKNRNRMPCEVHLLEYKNRAEVERAGIAVPTFVLADSTGVVVKQWEGWRRTHGAGECLCEHCFHQKIMQAMQQPPAKKAAAAIKARTQVAAGIEWIRQNVGENVPMTFRWDRTGEHEFPVVGGQADWSLEAICGQFGRFRLSAPGCKLPVDSAQIIYDIDGDHVRLQGDVEFDFSPHAPQARAGPVGSLSGVMTIFGVLKTIWGIWHTKIALTLGGNVSAVGILQGDTLTINIKRGLGAAIESAVSGKATVHQLQISPTQATAYFSGNPWIERFYPYKTFQLD